MSIKPRYCERLVRLSGEGYVFEYNPETRYVQAKHPLGGRHSLCEVVCPSRFVDTDEMGYAMAHAFSVLGEGPNNALSHAIALAPAAGSACLGGLCEWEEDADGSAWETSCRNRFLLNDGGPADNGLKFCPFCGKPLVEVDGRSDAGCTPIVPDGSPGLGPNRQAEGRGSTNSTNTDHDQTH